MINVHLITLYQTAALLILMLLHQLMQKKKLKSYRNRSFVVEMMNNKGKKGEQIKNKAQSFNIFLCGVSKQCLARAEVEHTLFDFHSSPAYQQCQLVD